MKFFIKVIDNTNKMKQNIRKSLIIYIQKDSFSIGTTNTENRTFSTGHVRWNWTPPQFFIDATLITIKNLAFSKQPYTSNRSFSTGHIRWNWSPPQFFIDPTLFIVKNLAFSKQPHSSNRSFSTSYIRWNWNPLHLFIASISKLKIYFTRSYQEQSRSSKLILLQAFISTFLIIIFILSKWEGIALLS